MQIFSKKITYDHTILPATVFEIKDFFFHLVRTSNGEPGYCQICIWWSWAQTQWKISVI